MEILLVIAVVLVIVVLIVLALTFGDIRRYIGMRRM
jgi:hypothetical protein